MNYDLNEKDVRATWKLLGIPEVELRVKKPDKSVLSVPMKSETELARTAKVFSDGECNVWIGLNPRVHDGTKSEDVTAVNWLLIDVDAPRPDKHEPATPEQSEVAKKVADRIIEYFAAEKWGEPAIMFSGNGIQLWTPLSIPVDDKNREEVTQRLRHFLHVLQKRYPEASIDSTADLSRVARLAGTINPKGARMAAWLKPPLRSDGKALSDFILSMALPEPDQAVEAQILSSEPEKPLDDEILKNLEKTDEKLRLLMAGEWKKLGYPSRSEAEEALCCKLLWYGCNKEQIYKILQKAIGKWREGKPSYRDLTYKKAQEFVAKARASGDLDKMMAEHDAEVKAAAVDVNEPQSVAKSFIEHGGWLYEEVYRDGKFAFAVWDGKKVGYVEKVTIDGIEHIPVCDFDAIEQEAVILPSEATDCGDVQELIADLRAHFRRYCDVTEKFELFSAYYVLLSWVYDRMNVLPYMRVIGDTGCGKSRWQDVVGRLCYKPMRASGALTSAPIFRMINKWHGTLIVDEADFEKSDETASIVKILNCGFERGRPVLRCNQEDANCIETLPTFCPKLLGTRQSFKDKALEARCLTEQMKQTRRKDIPRQLPRRFFEAEAELRARLLGFRFRHRASVNSDDFEKIEMPDIEPRLVQTTASFAMIFVHMPDVLEQFKQFVQEEQVKLIEERSGSWEGKIVEAVYALHGAGGTDISSADISAEIDDKDLTASKVGIRLRSLGLKTKVERTGKKTKRVLIWDADLMETLFRRYIPDWKPEPTKKEE